MKIQSKILLYKYHSLTHSMTNKKLIADVSSTTLLTTLNKKSLHELEYLQRNVNKTYILLQGPHIIDPIIVFAMFNII